MSYSLIPIDQVVTFDVVTMDPGTGSVTDADSAPTYNVFEDTTDAPILAAQTMTKRTSQTGDYRGTFTASAANGFEAGKCYNVVAIGTVTNTVTSVAITSKVAALTFRCAPAEVTAGEPIATVSGDFSATMKTSIGTAVAASAVASVTAGVSVGSGGIQSTSFAASAIDAAAIATDAIGSAELAAGAVTKISAGVFAFAFPAAYGSYTCQQILELIVASQAGKTSGAASTTFTIRNLADSADVIVATVDASGDRSAVTLTP